MGFKENVRRCRTALGWTLRQAADRAGVPLRTYQRWEGGEREPRLDGLKALAKAFGTTTDHLLRD
jgi:transcriptional regulator with XRE-family HTH domain